LENVDYQSIYDKYLIRGLPVIVGDSTNSTSLITIESLLKRIRNEMNEMIVNEPCSLETNLATSRYAQLDGIFSSLEEQSDNLSPWFLSFRNCKFRAVEFPLIFLLLLKIISLPFFILEVESIKINDEESIFLSKKFTGASIVVDFDVEGL
jgi:hypothetical protein